ncbi:hypothetical protein Droror1_Dr00027052 [Drosera rotundifolia]
MILGFENKPSFSFGGLRPRKNMDIGEIQVEIIVVASRGWGWSDFVHCHSLATTMRSFWWRQLLGGGRTWCRCCLVWSRWSVFGLGEGRKEEMRMSDGEDKGRKE